MIHTIKKHFLYYSVLAILQICTLTGVFLFAQDKVMQMTVIVLSTLFYVFWAIWHHYIHHTVTAKIVIEYVLMGILGIVIPLFIIF